MLCRSDEIELIMDSLTVQALNLQKPQYLKTASYGHFGNPEYSWEQPKKLAL